MKGALLVAGTTSDAGKSVVVAGLCRMLARRGVRVAPFKAQNMSNNSVVTLDGGEIGRAQALQARACGLEPSVRFNPVLLKPGSDRRSQLVVRGQAVDTVGAADYFRHRTALREVVVAELASLRAEFDVVLCEGAGSPAEINLRATDLANMGLARAADLPVLVVGDIDRGGVLAHLFGTVAVLEPDDQRLIAGFVVNKFRGDVDLLRPGLDRLAELTGRPTLGVLPFAEELWLDAEDSLGTVADAPVGRPRPPVGTEWLTVAAVRLPRISNSTDVEALACEPGVAVRWVSEPSRLADADLVVVPGSKSTVSDLAWLRRTGLGEALRARVAAGRPVLAICGGYQMLGRRIVDEVESGAGEVAGLGVFDLETEFAAPKVLRRVTGVGAGNPVRGYEIHHGRVRRSGDAPWLGLVDAPEAAVDGGEDAVPLSPEGSVTGGAWGTHVHGLLESDGFRRAWLREVAARAGRHGFQVAPDTSVAAVRAGQLDLLADLVEKHLDQDALERILTDGAPTGLPVLTVGQA
ncbi:cobyric acid synthase [Nocardia farcinica]|uniref:cobyric acid synthase n=1 Tax=Nocardia farcinica TaxID=37329 RepID=UPI0018940800|nr:cobyric acid synthase [Nocardia farcinica]MBF6261846.1 cobyric acid synthase [Nocardia farcinica]MBF6280385.1 cobyric acid synthase [Nocardia farcinica]MBF6305159.1 cobyric acid synthase [Nocardia farcinica]MBF6391772.1 cobyric acid synthase [Nocardia farcinica]MBF6490799.1 cobyric acid synthase [Nocardia farcinica]